jgi:predicted esterase
MKVKGGINGGKRKPKSFWFKIASFPVLFFSTLWILSSGFFTTPKYDSDLGDPEVVVIDKSQREDGYQIFYSGLGNLDGEIVVFLHGYGAINPMILGGWIKHLVDEGHVVIFPRYQEDLFRPAASRFPDNSAVAIKNALSYLDSNDLALNITKGGVAMTKRNKKHIQEKISFSSSSKKVFYIGHSYGGVIAANHASRLDHFGLRKPAGIMMCAPGSGALKGAVLESYDNIPSDVPLLIVSETGDRTVGEVFSEKVYSTSKVDSKIWFKHHKDSLNNITNSHLEPYSLYPAFDNGYTNWTYIRARFKSKTDETDTQGYWKMFDELMVGKKDPETVNFSKYFERVR